MMKYIAAFLAGAAVTFVYGGSTGTIVCLLMLILFELNEIAKILKGKE